MYENVDPEKQQNLEVSGNFIYLFMVRFRFKYKYINNLPVDFEGVKAGLPARQKLRVKFSFIHVNVACCYVF